MDRSWMNLRHRWCKEYVNGVKTFIQFAKNHIGQNNTIRCPCLQCMNVIYKSLDDVEDDLYIHGIQGTYTRWIFHGEKPSSSVSYSMNNSRVDGESGNDKMPNNKEDEENDILDMLNDFQGEIGSYMWDTDTTDKHFTPEGDIKKFGKLLKEAERELYPSCKKFSTLSFIVKLLHLKVHNHWSNKSFDMLLELLNDAFPEGTILPKSHYEAKKILRELGLGYELIHACKYDCALFWKEHKDKDECPECQTSRWKINDGKGKKIPYKILRYFPLKPRLQRLFMSRHTASDMRWHVEKRVDTEGVLRHPADAEAWKDFDKQYPSFAQDPRNVRLGLAADGFNPFGNMSNSYSMWPVILMPYNLPPWKSMKEPFLMLSLLIPGPQAPGKDIDVYLRPLIDELKELWDDGIQTYDALSKQTFFLKAAILWTINDFPAYANLSGWSTKGYKACPCCNEETSSKKLRSKICYIGHRRYLPLNHKWRKSKQFDGKSEDRSEPRELSGDDVLQQLECIQDLRYGKYPDNKKRKRTPENLNWTKKSIFFELPYWHKLKLRHNLDVMHIEKNVCDNLLGTILNIEGKTKDTEKARMDLADMKIRKELHLQVTDNGFVKPHACYTLNAKDKRGFLELLKFVKFPDGYASNISRCVSVKDGKISGLKSHDCHILLQRLLPVGIRGYLPKDVCTAVGELANFFHELCAKTLNVKELDILQERVVVILCKLEKIFPPAFFDIMVHLIVHLPREAKLGGPVQNRWMYPIERNLGNLKDYVGNKARPEGSIAEGYIVNECLTFISMYLRGIETKFNKDERNYDGGQSLQRRLSVFSHKVRPFGFSKNDTLTYNDRDLIRWYVLNNCEELRHYFDMHREELMKESNENIDQRQQQQFPQWLEKYIKRLRNTKSPEATDELYALACGPDFRVKSYSGCIVNGVRFHTKDRDSRRKTQNSGLVVEGEHDNEVIDFFGILTQIIELEYLFGYRVVIFKCEWFDTDRKKRKIQSDLHFTLINVSNKWYTNDPFVLAIQAKQVFYINDTKFGKNWQVVHRVNHRHLWNIPERVHTEDVEMDNDEIQLISNQDAYQQDEPSGIVWNVEVEEAELQQLHRDDVDPVFVNNSFVSNEVELDLDDLIYNESEEEDDTLFEYCESSDELEPNQTDSDMDIDT